MNAKIERTIKTQVDRYSTLEMAISAARNYTGIQAVIRGTDGKFWLTSPATAKKLEAAGFEIIRYAH